jgi:hypothetical protein
VIDIPLPDNPTVLDRILHQIIMAAFNVVDPYAVSLEPNGDSDIFPALEIYDSGDVVLEHESAVTRRRLTLTIEGYVEREDGAAATGERNALHANLVRAIMADETLGGIVEVIDPGDRRTGTAMLAEHRRLMFGQDFAIDYATDRYDPAKPA